MTRVTTKCHATKCRATKCQRQNAMQQNATDIKCHTTKCHRLGSSWLNSANEGGKDEEERRGWKMAWKDQGVHRVHIK